MKKHWFRQFAQGWSDRIDWSHQQLEHVVELLFEISERNEGSVMLDVDMPEELAREHALHAATTVLDGMAHRLARDFVHPPIPHRAVETNNYRTNLPFLEPRTCVPKIDLNSATVEELEGLPGIGPRTALRISEHRASLGKFNVIEDVKQVRGIGEREMNKFADQVYIAAEAPHHLVASSALNRFTLDPSFYTYLELLLDGVTLTRRHGGGFEDLKVTIVRALEDVLWELRRDPFAWRRLPAVRASTVVRREEETRHVEELESRGIEGPLHGGLLDDADYLPFLDRLLERAQGSIRVIQFFVSTSSRRPHPTDRLLDELVRAHRRGVDTKVILDRDAEGEGVGSRVINDAAYRRLSEAGVQVTWDSVDRATHTKLVIVDSEHVVLGSHNWTAGSFYAYDDTSVYVHSPDLGQHYAAQFEDLWAEYTDAL